LRPLHFRERKFARPAYEVVFVPRTDSQAAAVHSMSIATKQNNFALSE
jgi:hypothetical protein